MMQLQSSTLGTFIALGQLLEDGWHDWATKVHRAPYVILLVRASPPRKIVGVGTERDRRAGRKRRQVRAAASGSMLLTPMSIVS